MTYRKRKIAIESGGSQESQKALDSWCEVKTKSAKQTFPSGINLEINEQIMIELNRGFDHNLLREVVMDKQSITVWKTCSKDTSNTLYLKQGNEQLKRQNAALLKEVKHKEDMLEHYQQQFRLLQKKMFGASSEKSIVMPEQLSLFNEAEITANEKI